MKETSFIKQNKEKWHKFEQMYHQELSQVMAQKGLFGLGDWLANQVSGQTHPSKVAKAYDHTLGPSHKLMDSIPTDNRD